MVFLNVIGKAPHQEIDLRVYIQPNSKTNAIVGLHDNMLKIKISAPPLDGKANEEVVDFLSEFLRLPKSQIQVIKGQTSRKKVVRISNNNHDYILNLFSDFLLPSS